MEAETLKALKESIAKWDDNSRIDNPMSAKVGVYDCPLCLLFNTVEGCAGCPVSSETNLDYCSGTPYNAAESAWESGDVPAFRERSERERDFLISLLPEGETWK